MSDTPQASFKVIRESATSPFYRVEIKYLDSISAAIRWNDEEEGARTNVVALLLSSGTNIKLSFNEIDVYKANLSLEAELDNLFGKKEDEQ